MSDAATETLRVPIIGTAPFVLAPARNHPTTQQGSTTMATTTPKPDETPAAAIEISRIGTETLLVPITGMSPLITHKFSEKAKRQMLDAMQGRKNPKAPKDPEAEYLAAAYRLDDGGYGAPAIAFKSATVSAARFFGKEVSMVGLRQTLFFGGEFSKAEGQLMVRIEGSEPTMREDVVRVGNGGTDLRYRPFFAEWSATLEVTYVASMLTRASVLSLIEAGGLGVGVGEWRPEKKGDMGTYQIDPSREVEVK
jgi:hypothetical protein